VDRDGNVIKDSDNENGVNAEVVYTKRLCQPESILKMLEILLAFHAWYKKGYPFCLKTNDHKRKILMAIRLMMSKIKKNSPGRQERLETPEVS